MKNKYPTADECLEILKQAGCSSRIIKHSLAVKDLALKIAEKTNADKKLVEAGALLHDLGRTKTHTIQHVIEGVKQAKKLNLHLDLIKIIQRHIGAGLNSEEAKRMGLPPGDYIPHTVEEKIVSHADNLIYNTKKQRIEEKLEKTLKNGQKEYALKLIRLHKELSDICGIDLNEI